MDEKRVDRAVVRAALRAGGGRIDRRTRVGYGVVAGRWAELVLADAMTARGGVVRTRPSAGPIADAGLAPTYDRLLASGPVAWWQLFDRSHCAPDAAFAQTTAWLVDHDVWRLNRLDLRRGRRFAEADPDAAPQLDPSSSDVRIQLVTAITTVVTHPDGDYPQPVVNRWADQRHGRSLHELVDGLTGALALAQRGGDIPGGGTIGFGTPGFTGIGT